MHSLLRNHTVWICAGIVLIYLLYQNGTINTSKTTGSFWAGLGVN